MGGRAIQINHWKQEWALAWIECDQAKVAEFKSMLDAIITRNLER